MQYDIVSPLYDLYRLQGEIARFCEKARISSKVSNRVQILAAKSTANTKGPYSILLELSYSEKDETLMLGIALGTGDPYNPLNVKKTI